MEKYFVPYEIAIELYKLGFDEECLKYWNSYSDEKRYVLRKYADIFASDRMGAPLKAQAFEWFREKHNLKISFAFWNNFNGYMFENSAYKYECYIIPENGSSITVRDDSGTIFFKEYEDAEIACLFKLIEICKNKE